jgi:hypothetical protein
MKADSLRPRPVKEEGYRGIDDIAAQLIPCIGLGEYILCQAFRTVAAVGLLDGFENQIGHTA